MLKVFSKAATLAVSACAAFALCMSLTGCGSSETYTPETKAPQISSPAIGEDGKLRVGVNTSNSPLAGTSNGKIIGIDVDIAAAIADELGLSVEIVDTGNDPSGALTEGSVDVVLGIDESDVEKGYWKSSKYIPTGVVLFALESSSDTAPNATDTPKIAAQVSSKSAWAITNTYGEEALISASDLATAFGDLESGEAEYVASDAIIGLYAASRANIDVKIVALIGTESGYCAVVPESNTELQQALGDAIDKLIQNGVIGVIEKKWLGQTIDLSDVQKIETKKTTSNNLEEDEEGEDQEGEGGDQDATAGSSSSSSSSSSASANTAA